MPCGPLPEMLAPVLEHYRETLDDTAVLVPVGGLACLDFLADLTSGPSCALVADKGHASVVELCSHAEPAVVPHGAGFSLMVNFDCLARYVRERGGLAVLPGEPARSLVVAAFVRGEVADRERFAAAVQDELLDTGPDNFFALRSLLSGDGAASVETMLAGLRLARFDPTLLIELLPRLLEVLPAMPTRMRGEVGRVLDRVWDHWFPIGEPVDLALCVGLCFSAMERFPRAVDFFEMSVKEHPDSAPAAFAMAVARRGTGDLGAALEWVRRALELEPGFSEARTLRVVLDQEITDEEGTLDVPRGAGVPDRRRLAGSAGHLRRPAVHPDPVRRYRRRVGLPGPAVRPLRPARVRVDPAADRRAGATRGRLTQLVVRTNWRLLTGAFQLDVDTGELVFRTMLFLSDGAELSEPLCRGLVYSNVLTVDRCLAEFSRPRPRVRMPRGVRAARALSRFCAMRLRAFRLMRREPAGDAP